MPEIPNTGMTSQLAEFEPCYGVGLLHFGFDLGPRAACHSYQFASARESEIFGQLDCLLVFRQDVPVDRFLLVAGYEPVHALAGGARRVRYAGAEVGRR